MKEFFFSFLFVSLLFASACNKNSCIHGTVTDVKTGQPVSDASVRLNYQYSEMGSLKNQEATVYTDVLGEFSYSAEKKHSESIGTWEVTKTGYSGAYDLEREVRGCDEVQIKLLPYDGLLALEITNETGTHNLAYIEVENQCNTNALYGYEGYRPAQRDPLELLPGASHTQIFNGCAGDLALIRWKFTVGGPWQIAGSVLITDSDTTFYQINY